MADAGIRVKNVVPPELQKNIKGVDDVVVQFIRIFEPLEATDVFRVFVDARTMARYCECHVDASKIVPLATTDVPLEPEDQPEYRANRGMVTSHPAFGRMLDDAKKRRGFSNIVAEFTTDYDPDHPLKIIGGQHRYEAIKQALEAGVSEIHGVKVYFALDAEQRLDVQVISNTVIAVAADLIDRMQETVKGPELRDWCQRVGLLKDKEDFADRRQRGAAITVRAARTFIINYFAGREISTSPFDKLDTTPTIAVTGQTDPVWETIRTRKPSTWEDARLETAGKEFSQLVEAQRSAFKGSRGNADFQEKALNFAVLASWAYVAGLLDKNQTRLDRHYGLRYTKGKDPLNAAALAKGRHKTDAENYRGLGYRTDPKERGRFVELFWALAEKGEGIAPNLIVVAMAKYHAKQAMLEVAKVEAR